MINRLNKFYNDNKDGILFMLLIVGICYLYFNIDFSKNLLTTIGPFFIFVSLIGIFILFYSDILIEKIFKRKEIKKKVEINRPSINWSFEHLIDKNVLEYLLTLLQKESIIDKNYILLENQTTKLMIVLSIFYHNKVLTQADSIKHTSKLIEKYFKISGDNSTTLYKYWKKDKYEKNIASDIDFGLLIQTELDDFLSKAKKIS